MRCAKALSKPVNLITSIVPIATNHPFSLFACVLRGGLNELVVGCTIVLGIPVHSNSSLNTLSPFVHGLLEARRIQGHAIKNSHNPIEYPYPSSCAYSIELLWSSRTDGVERNVYIILLEFRKRSLSLRIYPPLFTFSCHCWMMLCSLMLLPVCMDVPAQLYLLLLRCHVQSSEWLQEKDEEGGLGICR